MVCVYASYMYIHTYIIYTTIAHRLHADVTLLPTAPVTSRTPVKRVRNSRDVGRRYMPYRILQISLCYKINRLNLDAAVPLKRKKN